MPLRRIETVSNESLRLRAKVYRDAEWREYRVRLKVDGEPRPDADYHTDCRRDADATARSMVEFASEWTDPVTNRSNTMTTTTPSPLWTRPEAVRDAMTRAAMTRAAMPSSPGGERLGYSSDAFKTKILAAIEAGYKG